MFLFFFLFSCTSPDRDTSLNITPPKNTLPSYTEPTSFSLHVTGETTYILDFSEHDCSNNNNQIRSFWRGSGHVFVLIAEIMQGYTGVNTYTNENSSIRIKLQEEAGGSALFYQATTDDISIQVEYDDIEGISGTASVETLEGGTIRLEPSQFYFGCSKLQ